MASRRFLLSFAASVDYFGCMIRYSTRLPYRSLLFALVLLSAFTAGASAAGVGMGPSFKGPVGLQLYSLRDAFAKDVPATLQQVRAFGFKEVELAGTYGLTPAAFKEMLDTNGLKAISGHFPYERFRDDIEGVAADAKILGLQYAGVAWIPHQDPFDEKTCREAAAMFNRAGKTLAKHGIKFFDHVHGYEFQPYENGTLLDLLMHATDPRLVCYEMDIFWIVFPGQDPVQLLKKYGRRWELMHLKDMKKGVKTGQPIPQTDVNNDVPLGAGQIDLPPLLKEAKRVRVRYYFIEDESASAAQQIPESLSYLEHLKWR